MLPTSAYLRRHSLVTFVTDRPGRDRRYAMDNTKIRRELVWEPRETFDSGFCAADLVSPDTEANVWEPASIAVVNASRKVRPAAIDARVCCGAH